MSEPRATLDALIERYPVFAARLPLAIGVRDELIAAGHDPDAVRRALHIHVLTMRYQRMLSKGGKRYHLDGAEAQDIDPEHIEVARQKVGEYDQVWEAGKQRRKEQKEQLKVAREAKLAQLEAMQKNAVKVGKLELVEKAAAGIAKVKAIESKPAPVRKLASVPSAKLSPPVAVVVKKKRLVVVPKS